jgi:hypothetical protein
MTKRLKETLYTRSGLNKRSDATFDFFETRLHREKLIQSLYENTRLYLFEQQRVNHNMMQRVETFARNHVVIDALYVDTIRDEEHNIIDVIGTNITNGKHRITNGLSQNIRDRRGVNAIHIHGQSPQNIMVVVFVTGYQVSTSKSGLHDSHAISAFKHGNTLYCFNPWGKSYLHSNVPDNWIWEKLRMMYRCDNIVVYTGEDYQKNNRHGVCIGLSVDFGTYMYNHLFRHNSLDITDFNAFVPYLFNTYIGAFGDFRSGCRVADVLTRLETNTKRSSLNNEFNNNRTRINTSQLNLLNTVNTLMNTMPSFKTAMRRSQWFMNNTNHNNNVRAARNEVLLRLREHEPGFRKVHGNAIHANMRRYAQSGNLRLNHRNAMNID